MELKSCNIFGRCRDKNTGKLTKISELHRDLLGLGKIQKAFNRLKANKAFYLSQSPEFRKKFSEELIFTSEDADAEPKLISFYENAHQVMPEVRLSDLRELLAKKFKEGEYSYEDAYNKMLTFNSQRDGGSLFIGTLVPQNNGKYLFRITYNTALELNALVLAISDRKAALTIITKLENLGVDVVEGVRSLYNSKNPSTVTKGLLGLITLKGGKENAAYSIKDLASETGHIVVAMLGKDNKLFQRLKKAIQEHPELVKKLLGDKEFRSYTGTKNATKEFMGHLVGLYLEQWDSITPSTKLGRLGVFLLRAVDYVLSKLHITNRGYYQALYDAKWAAYDMAKSFMGNNFLGTLNNALNESEILYGDFNNTYTNIEDTLFKISQILEKSKRYGHKVFKNYKLGLNTFMTELHNLRLLRLEELGVDRIEHLEEASGELILRIANFLTNEILQTKNLLLQAKKGVDIQGNPLSLSERAKVVTYSLEVLNLVTLVLEYKKDFQYIQNEDLRKELNSIFNLLSELSAFYPYSEEDKGNKGNYLQLIKDTKDEIAIELLTEYNGSDFVAMCQHVKIAGWKLVRNASKAESISDLMNAEHINGWIDRYIYSLSDNSDPINTLISLLVELRKHIANVKTLEYRDKLFDLYTDLRAIGIRDTRIFFEKDSSGVLTGNIVSARNWGEWERQYLKDKKEWEDRWFNEHKDLFPSKNEMYHNTIFLTAFGAWREGWHAAHSVLRELIDNEGNIIRWDNDTPKKRWMPAISSDLESYTKIATYDSPQWEKLQQNPKAAKWLEEYLKIKKELDALLPEGCTNALGIRAPQFTGTVTDALTNLTKGDGKVLRLGMSVRKYISYQVARNPSDTEFGGEHDTYNNEDLYSDGKPILSRALSNALNTVNRVPIYGVIKLPEIDKLSTDLIHSTIAYAAMAVSYSELDEIIDACQMVSDSMQRKTGNKQVVRDINKLYRSSNSYFRLNDYIQQQVCNNYLDSHLSPSTNIYLRKISSLVAKFGSLVMLGYNIHSALTNAYTAWNELWKEAHAGEEFNKRDFGWAVALYMKYWFFGFLLEWCNAVNFKKGSIIESTNKLDLFIKLHDVQNENERMFRDLHIQTFGWQFMKGWSPVSIAMSPYSLTDKWMQSIAFLAVARHTKLRNTETNKECSVWDAYHVVKERGKQPKLKLRGGEDSWLILDKNQALLNQIFQEKVDKGEELTDTEFKNFYEYEEVSGIDEKSEVPTNIIRPKRDLEGNLVVKSPYVPFDFKQQTLFKTRCRGINNRLHGVYNRSDGGAFLDLFLASMIASMKKYAIGLIDRRVSVTRYDARKREMVLGSYVTMGNIIWDCFSSFGSGDDTKVKHFLDKLEKTPKLRTLLKIGGNIVTGVFKFAYITMCSPITVLGTLEYLKRKGYSPNLIANVRRLWADMFRPLLIKFMMSFLGPPSPEEEDDDSLYGQIHALTQKYVDAIFNSPPVDWASDTLENIYLLAVGILPWDVTINDNKFLTKKALDRAVQKKTKNSNDRAFNMKAIVYYLLYRAYLEQLAYNVTAPLSIHKEYAGLLDSALPGVSALVDVGITIGETVKSVDDEELENLPKKERKKYHNGKEIILRDENKYWYKWAKLVIKKSPIRTLETWRNGYTSYESMRHFKEPWKKEKYTEGEPFISRR